MSEEIENPFVHVDKLVHAVQFGDFPFIETAISVHHVSPDIVDPQNCSLLHWAAINNRVQIAEFLVARQANVNKAGGDGGEIPLQWAVRYARCLPMVQLLLNEKSDVNHKSSAGYDSLYLAVMANQVHISFLLLNAGANPDTVDSQRDSTIIWLLKHRNLNESYEALELLRLVIAFHADVSQAGKDGNNALHVLMSGAASSLYEHDSDHGLGSRISSLTGRRSFSLEVAQLLYFSLDRKISAQKLKTNKFRYSTLLTSLNDQGLTPWGCALYARNYMALRFLCDAWQFRSLPYAAPIAIRAIVMTSFFILLEIFGWMHGLMLSVAVVLVLLFFEQGAILPQHSSRTSCGAAWGIIFNCSTAYYMYIARYQSLFVQIMIALLVAVICISLVLSMVTSPQRPASREKGNHDGFVDRLVQAPPIYSGIDGSIMQSSFRLCCTCLTEKPLLSMHCSACDTCVIGLDHHCSFVNNCVGRSNRRIFVLFTLCAAIGCGVMTQHSFTAQFIHLCGVGSYELTLPWWERAIIVQICMLTSYKSLALITYMAFVSSLSIALVFISQMYMVAKETTTFAAMKRPRSAAFEHSQGLRCCSRRGVRNLLFFARTGRYTVTAVAEDRGGKGAVRYEEEDDIGLEKGDNSV